MLSGAWLKMKEINCYWRTPTKLPGIGCVINNIFKILLSQPDLLIIFDRSLIFFWLDESFFGRDESKKST
jgi:hypothetical protein